MLRKCQKQLQSQPNGKYICVCSLAHMPSIVNYRYIDMEVISNRIKSFVCVFCILEWQLFMVAFFISFFDAFYYSDFKIYVLIFRSVILVTINYRFWFREYVSFSLSANQKCSLPISTHTCVAGMPDRSAHQCANSSPTKFYCLIVKN